MWRAPYRDIHCKNVRGSNGISAPRSAQPMALMSQHLRRASINWRNPAVRAAIYEVMRFWFRRGVDGFRVDVVWHLIKDDEFRDNPSNADFRPTDPPHHRLVPLYTTDRPEVHVVIAEMRRVADEFPDRVLIGEIYLPLELLVAYSGRDLAGMHLPLHFSLLTTSWNAPS